MSMIRLAVGGDYGTDGYMFRMYDGDGTLLWSKTLSYEAYAVAFDAAGNVYVADTGGSRSIRKYTLSGTEITSGNWPIDDPYGDATPINPIYAISYDASDGGLAVASQRPATVPYASIYKFDSDGALEWTDDHGTGGDFYGIACDGSGNTWAGGARVSTVSTRKYDSGGSRLYSKDHGTTVWAVACDSSQNVVTGGGVASGTTTRVYNSSGTQQWSANHGNTVLACCFDASGNVLTGGWSSSSVTTRLYNSSGTEQWTANHGATVRAVAADADGYYYAAGNVTSGVSIRKYDSSGNEVTDGDWPLNHGATVRCLACYEIVDQVTESPALAVPVALKPPEAQIHAFQIPALGIPLALASPTYTNPPIVPTTAGRQLVFRCYLTGQSDLIEWPIAALAVNRYRDRDTYLGVQCPVNRSDVESFLTLSPQLVIYAGIRESGVETLGEWLRGNIYNISYEQTPFQSIATLSASWPAAAESPAARVPILLATGRQDDVLSARCVLDLDFAPGDTTTIDSTAITIGSIAYVVRPNDGWMEIEQDG